MTRDQLLHENFVHRMNAAVHERMHAQSEAYARARKDQAYEAVVGVCLQAVRFIFNLLPDLAARVPSDADRRRLAEQIANLILGGS